MRSLAPALIPVLRSDVQGRMLADLLLHPDDEVTLTDLARRVEAPLSTVHAEVGRLVASGILVERAVGRSRVLRANAGSALVRPLTELIALTFGPGVVVAEEFAAIPGVERVLVFGSWAARLHGEPGPPPNDVDVLVVGTPVRAEVYDAAERAERRLRLPVNPIVRSPERFGDGGDPLVREILSRPYVTAVGADP